MSLNDLKKVWDDWAQEDPLWAILSVPSKSHGRWDLDEFFVTGQQEIRSLIDEIERQGFPLSYGRCLDFGCGVGRLTQGLADYFERCDGVDISETMVKNARFWNKHLDRCFYHVNDQPNLSLLPSDSFDLIYSNIVLQHIEPDVSEKYIEEFIRLLSPGGLAVFQVPAGYVAPTYDPLPGEAHQASIQPLGELPLLATGKRVELRVVIRNTSPALWLAASAVHVGNHWKSADGATTVALDDGRGLLPQDVRPGEEVTADLVITGPATAGTYLLEIDLVEEGVCWFADRGSPVWSTTVDVTVRPPDEPDDNDAQPPVPFSMHALPQARVMAAVNRGGGHFLAIESNNPAGEGWESYRYFASKATPPAP